MLKRSWHCWAALILLQRSLVVLVTNIATFPFTEVMGFKMSLLSNIMRSKLRRHRNDRVDNRRGTFL